MKKLCYTLLILLFTISSFTQSNTFTDKRDGKVYKTVKIGNQTWMAENLAFRADSNCWAYYNDQNFVAKYGYLYNWETAKTVCPSGWHLPSEEEFETLLKNCEGNSHDAYEALSMGGRSGFAARFGGWYSNNDFCGIGNYADFCSSTPDGVEYARLLELISWMKRASTSRFKCSNGLSVRCLKNN
jgi:uncharacterized protein (TIGR02145 family)